MIEIVAAIALVLLLSAPIAFAGSAFVHRPFGSSAWRGDPWPIGVQEEDLDHAWGEVARPEDDEASEPSGRASEPVRATMEDATLKEAVLDDLDEMAAGARPVVTPIHATIRRDA